MVREFNHIACSKCGFLGTAVDLLAKVEKRTVPVAYSDLVLAGAINLEREAAEQYLGKLVKNAAFRAIFDAGQALLAGDTPSPIRELLSSLNCEFNPIVTRKLGRYASALFASDFRDVMSTLGERWEKVLKRLKGWSCIGIPCWDGAWLVGLWLIRPQVFAGGYEYLQIQESSSAIGFSQGVHPGDDTCFVTNDPIVALRHTSRQLVDQMHVVPFLCPYGRFTRSAVDCSDVYFLPAASAIDRAYTDLIAAAIRVPGAQTVQSWQLKYVLQSTWPVGRFSGYSLCSLLRESAVPSYQALGTYLLSQKPVEAAKLARQFNLSLPEQNQVLAYFGGKDLEFLLNVMETDRKTASVRLDRYLVVETKNGWMVDEELISEATIRLAEMRTDAETGKSWLCGTVMLNNTVFPFKEDYDLVRKNPAAWLDQFLRRQGVWARINARWSSKLLDIAKLFSADKLQVIASNQSFGWDKDKTLRFPKFTVDVAGVRRSANKVHGPDIPFPAPLAPSDWEAFLQLDFCSLFLAVIGNLVRTAHKMEPFNLAVSAAPNVVNHVAATLGTIVHRNPDMRVVEREAAFPFPMFVNCGDEELARLLLLEKKQVMCSVDSRTFTLLAVDPKWVRLNVAGVTGYDALRAVFHLLPKILDGKYVPSDDKGQFYRTLASHLAAHIGCHKPMHQIRNAGSDLDRNWMVSESGRGTCALRLLQKMVEDGHLAAEKVADGYRIAIKDVRLAFTSPIVPPLDVKRFLHYLVDGGMLAGSTVDHFTISPTGWDLVKSWG